MKPIPGPSAQVAVGSVLRESLVLVLRSWLIVIVSLVALGEACLLIISLLGRCFTDYGVECSSEWATLDGLQQWAIKRILIDAAGISVLAAALYFFYSSARTGMPQSARLSGSAASTARFFGRTGLLWVLIILPLMAADFAFGRLMESLNTRGLSHATFWSISVMRALAIALYLAYLNARTVFYLPSAAYDREPLSLGACWRRSASMPRLFVVFAIFAIGAAAADLGFFLLMRGSPLYFSAVDAVSTLLGVRSDYVMNNLGDSAAYVLIDTPETLLEAAASLIIFRKMMPAAEQSTADIFS